MMLTSKSNCHFLLLTCYFFNSVYCPWQVSLTQTSDYQLVFEGIRGTSYQGDIAIDDIVLLDNTCPPPGDCNFETGMCTWVNVPQGDDFDWLRGSGSTTSLFTGPSTDHTTNSTGGKWFIWIVTEQRHDLQNFTLARI